jgi:hypothetical protein
MTINLKNVRKEICHLLRNADILSISVRGVATKTDTFTATAGQTIFTLTSTNVKNIRSLSVNSVAKKYLKDYNINFTTGVVTLIVGALVGESVVINYDYGSGDKIYPDMPRTDLSLTSFPRVGISLVNLSTKPLGLGGTKFISDILISIYTWMPANKDTAVAGGLGGTEDISDLIYNIRNTIEANAKLFYTFQWIEPMNTSPILAGQNNKIIQQSHDFSVKFLIE